jgi:hypothetical protein
MIDFPFYRLRLGVVCGGRGVFTGATHWFAKYQFDRNSTLLTRTVHAEAHVWRLLRIEIVGKQAAVQDR